MNASRTPWLRWVHAALGAAVSLMFGVALLIAIDVEAVGAALGDVALVALAMTAVLSMAEVATRALRWRALLQPHSRVSLGRALGYLSVGHLANAVLPARLGDLARAFLAGGSFGISRACMLGTIAVERVADALLLATVAVLGIALGFSSLSRTVAVVGGAAVIGIVLIVLLRRALYRRATPATWVGQLTREFGLRFFSGARALRSRRSLAAIGAATVVSFGLATAMMHVSASAVGLAPGVWQSAVIVAAVTLSTAIPAGPASIGTYEFVGVAVMGVMGYPAEPSLVAVGIVHVVATLVPSTMGLVAMWAMGISDLRSIAASAVEDSHQETPEPLPASHVAPSPFPHDLSVVIPAHNAAGVLGTTLEDIRVWMGGRPGEITVVENGSSDDTAALCTRVAATWPHEPVALRVLSSDPGLGNAYRVGIAASRGSWILLTADDLPFGTSDVDAAQDLVRDGRPLPPMTIGSKAHPASAVDRGVSRAVLTRCFAILRRLILRMRTGDPQGTIVLDGTYARAMVPDIQADGFMFTTELVYAYEQAGIETLEVPVQLAPSHRIHASRVSLAAAGGMAVGLIGLRVRRSTSRRPVTATRRSSVH